ncbi:glycosyltransferase [Paraliomyxa miuraensis]|uniref:glycosyltransferase n=1 Tax=Paraliomyxa miuraensis TaxID=376150 RepID=UPI0022501646|nr:nucleotide disphospho-sugar-binding domain-containing protein [Paraliomyxa miuraensis]MCX4245030.1 glycosyltransferase [Paraliomyxa miuraensis]
MSRFLFVVIPERGHVHPYLGPAACLRARGHEVVIYAEGPLEPVLEPQGLPRWPPTDPAPEARHAGAEFSARVRDHAWLRQWVAGVLLDGVEAQVPRIEAAIAALRPDALVLDPMVYAGAIAAHRTGLPWAAVSNSLNPVLPDDLDSELLRTVAWLSPRRAARFEAHGMAPRFRGCDLLSPTLTVCFSSRALVGEPPPGVHLVGASLPLHPREPPSGIDWGVGRSRPRVLMSLGSQVYHQPRMFQTVIEALRELPVELVASVGELDPASLGPWPPGAIVRPWLPQLEVLARCDAMITHGGANSVMEALAHDVPVLVSPICNDQFHQAKLVARAGLGSTLDLHTATAEQCRAAVRALLSPEQRARVVGCLPRDGAQRCCDLLERWAARASGAR